MKSFIIRIIMTVAVLAVMTSWYFIPDSFFVEYSDAKDESIIYQEQEEQELKEEQKKSEQKTEKPVVIQNKQQNKIKQSVPFTVQAPHAQWDESRYQDACEEASLVMANAWINGDKYITKNNAEDEMEKLFSKSRELFGDVIDLSATDTAKLFEEYYGHKAEVVTNISMDDIYNLLDDGNIIIAPTNGKWLENPHFTNDGPDRHMLVILGYDRKNGEFITNDPGTKVGRGYKYKDSTLYNAIRDYSTGNKQPIQGVEKTVIVIKK